MNSLASLGATPEESDTVGSLIRSIDRFAIDEIRSAVIDREGRIPRRLIEGLAELGVFGAAIPEKYGGAGMSLHAATSVVSALAARDRSVATTVGLHLGLGTRGLVRYGSRALHEAYLPSLAAGSKIAAFATTEAGAGSDLMAISTRAVTQAPGTLRVNGTKIFVTNGGFADIFTVTAATPDLGGARRSHSLLLLERGDSGVSTAGEENKLGLRGSSTTTLLLDGAEIPIDRVIGEHGRGMEQLQHVLAWGRTAMAAGCCGAAHGALAKAMEHVTTRRQFGRVLASFEVVREQIADMGALHYAMDALVRFTASSTNDALLAVRSTSAKIFCSEGNWRIADTAVQLHGGSGFIEETGLPLFLRDARITRIFEGANDVLAVHGGALAAASPPAREPMDVPPGLASLATTATKLARSIDDHRAELVERYGVRLLGQQRLVHRLGRLFVLRDACDAAVLRAAGEPDGNGPALATHWLEIAQTRIAALLLPLASAKSVAGVSGPLIARYS